MTELVFDGETNGLLDTLDRVHCIAVRDPSERKTDLYVGDEIPRALDRMDKADRIIGHNIIDFDIPAIQKVYQWEPKAEVFDTLVVSRMAYLDLKAKDAELIARKRLKLPKHLIGSHKLEAWGYRLGYHKGDYKAEMEEQGLDPWAAYNDSMGEYCINDADLTTVLLDHCRRRGLPREAVEMEHKLFYILREQMRRGVYFDEKGAVEFYAELCEKREKVDRELRERFGWWWKPGKKKAPKRNNSRYGYVEGAEFTPISRVDFNPSSRQHIAKVLQERRNWKPKRFTPAGQPQVDESVLGELPWPEAQHLTEYLLIDKRISQLAEGKHAWLKAVKSDSRIYHRINQNGTITGRGTHSSPNLGQVPRLGNPYGKECRSRFVATPGLVMIGADLAGLELRMLAHYMGYWDGGDYAREVVEGDVHSINQKAAGLETRDLAKTFFYALAYGAGDAKIGSIIGKGAKAGKKLKAKFMDAMPAFGELNDRVQAKAKKYGYLRTLNGVKIPVRSQHAALNTLLQSSGSVVTKQSIVNFHQLAQHYDLEHGKHFWQVLWVHDEIQCEAPKKYANNIGELMVQAFRMTTSQFNLNCPMDGDFAIGPSWAETH